MSESLSDYELIAGCLSEDKGSWDAFVERFSKLVYWSIRKTLEASSYRTRTDLIREVFQDFFARLLEKNELERLQSRDKLRKFLVVMACHMTTDKIRSLSRDEKWMGDDEAPVESVLANDNSPSPLSEERRLMIQNALGELSPKQRLCLEWHFVEGKTHRDIADILGLPQEAVSAVIRRSREKLKKIFSENDI